MMKIFKVCRSFIISECTQVKYNDTDMNRDTNELPLIMAELEESADAIDTQ